MMRGLFNIILLDLMRERACQQTTLHCEAAQTASGDAGDEGNHKLTPCA